MAGRQGTGSPFAVDAELPFPAAYGEGFEFGDIVADIIQESHPHLPGTLFQCLFKGFPGPVHEELTVGPGIVGRRRHGGVVILAAAIPQEGAGQLSIRK